MIQIDELIRSARRSIALIIKPDGSLLVRAPHQATDGQIQAFIQRKSSWIRKNQAKVRQKNTTVQAHRFEAGEVFLFLGQKYHLQIVEKTSPLLAVNGDSFQLARSAKPRAAEVITRWYQAQARQIFEQRLQRAARENQLSYQQMRLSSAKTRWGSCSSTGTISLTWRLVMAPPPVIDYVIIHELAHIKVKNHSKKFWEVVAAMMPDYQRHRQWLKENGHLLAVE